MLDVAIWICNRFSATVLNNELQSIIENCKHRENYNSPIGVHIKP